MRPVFPASTAAGLCIGDLRVSVAAKRPEILAHVRDRYRVFLTDQKPDFEIEMATLEDAPPADFLGVPPDWLGGFGTRGADASRQPRSGRGTEAYRGKTRAWNSFTPAPAGEPHAASRPRVVHAGQRVFFQRQDFAACLDLETCRGRNIFEANMKPFAIESFLRICYSFLAVLNDGLLLHSAGVVRGQSGYIFPGQSGTGKSTIAGLARPSETVLSDEMVVIRYQGGRHRVFSTPFYGTNRSAEQNLSADLKAAFLPIKAEQVRLEKAAPARSLSKLMAGILFFGQDTQMHQRLLDTSLRVVERVPFYDMHFRRDGAFWDCIAALEQQGGG